MNLSLSLVTLFLTIPMMPGELLNQAPSVAVFGSGVSGLTAATHLSENGFAVTVYERENWFGGKTSNVLNEQGWPLAVNNRGHGKSYLHVNSMIERFGDGLGILNPVDLNFMLDEKLDEFVTLEAMVDLLKPACHSIYREDMLKVRKASIEASKYDFSNGSGLSSLSFKQFVLRAGVKNETLPFLSRMYRNFWAADLDANADVMVLHPDASQTLPQFDYLKQTNIIDGPVSERLISPWIDYLKSLGVKFVHGVGIESFQLDSVGSDTAARVNGVRLTNMTHVSHDAYVLAIGSFHASQILPWMDEDTFAASQRWTFTMHWHLRTPDTWPPCLMVGNFVLTEIEFSCAYIAHDKNANGWTELDWSTTDVAGTLVVTCMAEDDSMLLTKNIEEMKTAFLRHSCIDEESAADLLVFGGMHPAYSYLPANTTRFESQTPPLQGPIQENGYRWSMHHPLFIPRKGELRVPTQTRWENLVLAGEYVKSDWIPLPTIEQASETGYKAAQALVNYFHRNSTDPSPEIMLRIPPKYDLDYHDICDACHHDTKSSDCRKQVVALCVSGDAPFKDCLEFSSFSGAHDKGCISPSDPFLLYMRRRCGMTLGAYFEYGINMNFYFILLTMTWVTLGFVVRPCVKSRLIKVGGKQRTREILARKLRNVTVYVAELFFMTGGLIVLVPVNLSMFGDESEHMENIASEGKKLMLVAYCMSFLYFVELLVKQIEVSHELWWHHVIFLLLTFSVSIKDGMAMGDSKIQLAVLVAGYSTAMCGLTQHAIYLSLLLHELRFGTWATTQMLWAINWVLRLGTWAYAICAGLFYAYVMLVGHTVPQRVSEYAYYAAIYLLWWVATAVNIYSEYNASTLIYSLYRSRNKSGWEMKTKSC